MESLSLTLIIILIVIVIAPIISGHMNLPVIVIEIIIGMFIGKSFFNIIPAHPFINYFSEFGLIYLMFLAGLEINFDEIAKYLLKTITISIFSIVLPFSAGLVISSYVGVPGLLLGVIFSTTSLGLILPLSRELRMNDEFSHVLLGSVVLIDIISMFLLAFALTMIKGKISLSFIYSILMILTLFMIPWLIKRFDLQKKVKAFVSDRTHFEIEVRFSFALIAVFAVISGTLGFHAIIGSFIAGLIISELNPYKSILNKKLESFGYGFFIPLFFILMGAKINLPLLFSNIDNLKLLSLIIITGILSKIFSVGFASRLIGYNIRESFAMGMFHCARLSLIIAAIEIGSEAGYITENLFSAFMTLAVISAIFGPSVGKLILMGKQKPV